MSKSIKIVLKIKYNNDIYTNIEGKTEKRGIYFMETRPYLSWELVENFMVDAFKAVGVPEEDARICADVLAESCLLYTSTAEAHRAADRHQC